MTWTANLKSKRQEINGVYIGIEFTDGNQFFVKDILISNGDINSLNNIVQNEIDNLQANSDLLTQLDNIDFSSADVITKLEPTITQLKAVEADSTSATIEKL